MIPEKQMLFVSIIVDLTCNQQQVLFTYIYFMRIDVPAKQCICLDVIVV